MKGEVTTWRLHGPVDDMSCAIAPTTGGFALAMRHGRELILAEFYARLESATRRADQLRSRLRDRGWEDGAT
jgi:hypothetical protein